MRTLSVVLYRCSCQAPVSPEAIHEAIPERLDPCRHPRPGRDPGCHTARPRLGSAPFPGFADRIHPASGKKQREAEAHALTVPTPDNARRWLRILTAEPHVAGTPADYKTAVFVRDKLREWGWKADLAEMDVLLNYPKNQSLELYRPSLLNFNLNEAPIATDKDSASSKAFGAFNGYAPRA